MNAKAQNYSESATDEQDALTIENVRRDALIVATLPLAISLYILVVTIAYEFKINRSCHRKEREADKFRKTDGRMGKIILCAACIIVVRQIMRTLEVSEGFISDNMCLLLRKVTDALYVLGISFIYFALWMRQRVFYKSSLSATLNTNFTRILGWSVIVLIISGAGGGIVLYLMTMTYKSSELGCIMNHTSIHPLAAPIYYISTIVLFQLILLFLFIYPIVKQNTLLHKTQLHTFSRPTYKLIRRVAFVTVADVALDIFIIVLIQLLRNIMSHLYIVFFFDTMLIKSCVCVICSFRNWSHHLIPFRCLSRTNGHFSVQMRLLSSIRNSQ